MTNIRKKVLGKHVSRETVWASGWNGEEVSAPTGIGAGARSVGVTRGKTWRCHPRPGQRDPRSYDNDFPTDGGKLFEAVVPFPYSHSHARNL